MSRRSTPIVIDFGAPMCSSGKRAYRTEDEARTALAGARSFRKLDVGYKRGHIESRHYRCKGCGFWHLTSRGKR